MLVTGNLVTYIRNFEVKLVTTSIYCVYFHHQLCTYASNLVTYVYEKQYKTLKYVDYHKVTDLTGKEIFLYRLNLNFIKQMKINKSTYKLKSIIDIMLYIYITMLIGLRVSFI